MGKRIDISTKVIDLYLRESVFQPDSGGEPVQYFTLIVEVLLDGEQDVLELKCDRKTAKLFKAATTVPENFLESLDAGAKKS
jgi:hypothetical protein